MENEFPVENVSGFENPDFMEPGKFYIFTLEGYGYEPITMTGLYMGAHGVDNKGYYKFFVYSPKEAEGIFVADTVGGGYIDPVTFTAIRQATAEEVAQLPIQEVEARVKNRQKQHNLNDARMAARRQYYAAAKNVKGGRRRKTARRKIRKSARKTKGSKRRV